MANALRPVWRAPRNSWAQREVHEDPGDLPAASRILPSRSSSTSSAFVAAAKSIHPSRNSASLTTVAAPFASISTAFAV